MDVNSVLQNTRQYFQGIPSSSPVTGELAPGASVGYSSPPVSSTATSVTSSASGYTPYAGFPPTSWSSQSTSQNYYSRTPPANNAQGNYTQSAAAPYHFYENARSQKSLPSTSNSFVQQHNYTAPSITRLKEGVNNQGMFNMDSIVCQPNVNYMQGKKPKMKTSMPPSSSSLSTSSVNVYKQPTRVEESRFFNSHAPSSQNSTLPVTLPPRVPSVMSHTSATPSQLQRPPETNANHESYPHSPLVEQRVGFQQQVSYHSSSTVSVRALEKTNSREPVDVRYYINRRIETTALQASPAVSKRDSPLDLSVKTIRQSADSTAHDDNENAYNHHNFPVTLHPIRDGRHSHLPQLPFAGNLATAAVSLPNVHNHSNSAFNVAQRSLYASNSSPGYTSEAAYRPMNNGVQEEKMVVQHPVSEIRNEKMTFSFTYEQKQQMHRTQVNAQVSAMRYSQYYQQNEHEKAVTQQSLIIERGNTSMNQLLSEKNFAAPNAQKPPATVAKKRKTNFEPTTPIKNPRVSLEWRENIDKEIENRLNEYTSMKAREEKEKQAAKRSESYRDVNHSQTSNKSKEQEHSPLVQQKLPFTQYLEQHKAQHKLPVQPVQAHPQWYHNTQSRTHLSNHQYPQRPEPHRGFQDAHSLKFNKTSYEPRDLKIIEKIENMKHANAQEQRPLPPFRAFSMQPNHPAPDEPRQRKSSTHKLHKLETESALKIKEIEENQSRAALMASALAHPRIRTKAELKQVIPVDKSEDKTSAGASKLPDAQSVNKLSRFHYDTDQKFINAKGFIDTEHVHKPANFSKENSTTESYPVMDLGKQFSPPRKRSFSREDTVVTVHRSSSETTVFDFRSDSEPETTPTDLHGLSNMRKDRKNRTPSVTPTIIDQLKEEQIDDTQWLEACDELIQQFSNGGPKRRGRRKKIINVTDKENEPIKQPKESEEKIIPEKKIKKEIIEDEYNSDRKVSDESTRKVSDVDIKKEQFEMQFEDEHEFEEDDDDDDVSDDDEDEDYEPEPNKKNEAKESKSDKVNVTLEIRGQRSNVSTTRIRIQNSLEDSSDTDDSLKEEFDSKKSIVKKAKVIIEKRMPMRSKNKIIARKKGKNIDPKREKMRHMILRRMETRKSKMDSLKATKKPKPEPVEEPKPMMTRKMTRKECQKEESKKRINEDKAKLKVEEKIKNRNEKEEKKKEEKKKEDKPKTKNKNDVKVKDRPDDKKSKEKQEEKPKAKVNEKPKISKEKSLDKSIKKECLDDEKPKLKDKTEDNSPRNKLRSGDKLKKSEPKEKEDITRRSLRSRNVIVVNDKSTKKVKKSDPPKENTKSSAKLKKESKNAEKKQKSDIKPSWEEELFNYKYSLRMPVKLINIARPPNWPKSSGGASSLPDLDRSETDSDLLNDCSKESKTPKIKNKDESKVSNSKEFKDSVKFLKEKFDKKIEEKNKTSNLTTLMMEKKMKIIPKSSDGPELLPTPSLESFKLKLNSKTDTSKKSDVKKSKNTEDNVKEEMVENPLLGSFRKETVDMFKEVFEKHHLPNQFKTVILESRTRTQTKEMKHNATLKQVFGCDRPASAPPVSDSIEDEDKKVKNSTNGCLKKWQNSFAKLKLLVEENCHESKKDVKEFEDSVDFVYNVDDSKDNEIGIENVVKKKTRSVRRKCRSSGFDYIRKKKKQKKEEDEDLLEEREKRKAALALRPTPESIEDIQNEIRSWVVNKGIGETVLHKAARLGYSDISSYCLEKLNCAPSPTDNAGYTPLHEACTRGHLKIAKMLLKYGADVSASAKGGIRPLHEAVENGNVELVRLLLSYGADPLLSTYAGQTPLSLVKEEQDDLREFLLLYLADIQGTPSKPWPFIGYDNINPELCGYDPLKDSPPSPPEEISNLEFEISDQMLPNLYRIKGEPADNWVLCSDLPARVRESVIKRNDQNTSFYTTRKMSRSEFDENVECASYLESKFLPKNKKGGSFTLVKYNDKLLLALNIQTLTMTFS